MLSWHLTFSSDGRQALFPSEAQRRWAVRTLARVAGAEILLFCIVDDHVHVVLSCTADRASRLAQALLLALRALTAVPIDPAHVRPVDGRSHLKWLVSYCITQPTKHGLAGHPALWSGSCFLDLVGARLVEGLHLPLSESLPRLRLRSLFPALGLPDQPIDPVDDDALRGAGIAKIIAASGAALATGPVLDGRTTAVVQTRRAIAALAKTARIPTSQVAWGLGLTPQATRRLTDHPVDDRVLTAVRTRLGLEARVARVGVE